MDSLLNRYRNITVLLLVIAGQLILLAVQVKNDQDIRFIRVWTITAVTPFARLVEAIRGGGAGFIRDYIHLHDADAENRQLRDEIGRLKMDNIFLRNEVQEADRVKALEMFQAETQSKTLAARVFGVGAAASAKMVYVDRGSADGVERGMAVVTPDGIVGKVIAAYPTASQVLLVTDPDFAAGVISQKNQTRGDLKGTGKDYCIVDYVPIGDKVDPGEWFYTSGDDRIFPRGFPVGVVKEVRNAQPFKEILVDPSGPRRGLEDVLIILNGVHQEIPPTPPANQPVYVGPPPPGAPAAPDAAADSGAAAGGTAADRLRARYKAIGDEQNHIFGEGLPGSKPPNFNLPLPATGASAPARSTTGASAVTGPAAAAKPAAGAPAVTGPAAAPKRAADLPAGAEPAGAAKQTPEDPDAAARAARAKRAAGASDATGPAPTAKPATGPPGSTGPAATVKPAPPGGPPH